MTSAGSPQWPHCRRAIRRVRWLAARRAPSRGAATQTYHLVLGADAPASGNHHYAWGTAFSYDETNDLEDAGWAIGNRRLRQDGNGAWGGGGHIPGKLSLTATPK